MGGTASVCVALLVLLAHACCVRPSLPLENAVQGPWHDGDHGSSLLWDFCEDHVLTSHRWAHLSRFNRGDNVSVSELYAEVRSSLLNFSSVFVTEESGRRRSAHALHVLNTTLATARARLQLRWAESEDLAASLSNVRLRADSFAVLLFAVQVSQFCASVFYLPPAQPASAEAEAEAEAEADAEADAAGAATTGTQDALARDGTFCRRVGFVHIPKTGGTTAFESLLALARETTPSMLLSHKHSNLGWDNAAADGGHFKNHATAEQQATVFGEAVWDNAFTFTVMRHPMSLLVSHFFFTVDVKCGRDVGAHWRPTHADMTHACGAHRNWSASATPPSLEAQQRAFAAWLIEHDREDGDFFLSSYKLLRQLPPGTPTSQAAWVRQPSAASAPPQIMVDSVEVLERHDKGGLFDSLATASNLGKWNVLVPRLCGQVPPRLDGFRERLRMRLQQSSSHERAQRHDNPSKHADTCVYFNSTESAGELERIVARRFRTDLDLGYWDFLGGASMCRG